jgi:hypothetical protein
MTTAVVVFLTLTVLAQSRLIWLYHLRHKQLAASIDKCSSIIDPASRAALIAIVEELGSAYRVAESSRQSAISDRLCALLLALDLQHDVQVQDAYRKAANLDA